MTQSAVTNTNADANTGETQHPAGEPAHTAEAEGQRPDASRKSMGKRAMQRAASMHEHTAPPRATATEPGVSRDVLFERLPQVSHVAGAALQADIMELNRAVIRLLQTAARMGGAEPLAPLLLGTSQDMIDLFLDPGRGERLLAQSIGFPLVQLRIHDVGVMRQVLADGLVSASSVQGLTRTFPLEVIEGSTRSPRTGG